MSDVVRRKLKVSGPSRLGPLPAARRSQPISRVKGQADDDELSAAQVRELKRRVVDLHDPIRYLLVSRMGPKFVLYYNVSDGMYAMNDPKHGTLFKRRDAALAVKRLLGSGVRIVRCTTKRRRGKRVPLLETRSVR